MAVTTQPKQDFSTRLSAATLSQLDALVRTGRYRTRTAVLEEAVRRLFNDQEDEWERKRRAFEATRGALSIGITPESFREAEIDRLEFEADKNSGRLKRR
jgi:Arc/MetJ-type ribon-helix-helix transcriptional regulator